MYPPNWPACKCGEPCMDGKATCGRVECSIVRAREGTTTTGQFINACGSATGYPPPGSDATTEDGRFIGGPGYGGERM